MSGGRVPDHEYQPSAGISGPDQVREYDDLPEQAFMFASTIEDVVEKAKAMEK